MDYITRYNQDPKSKRHYVSILTLDSKRVAEIWIDANHLSCTETTLLEIAEVIAQKLTGGKNRQLSFLDDRDLPPVPRSRK